jgi:hypothetical protein
VRKVPCAPSPPPGPCMQAWRISWGSLRTMSSSVSKKIHGRVRSWAPKGFAAEHVTESGTFVNPPSWDSHVDRGMWEQFQLIRTRESWERPEMDDPAHTGPPAVVDADVGAMQNPPSSLYTTWTSHASFFTSMHGVNVLSDPVWSERCSPV